MSTNSPVQVTDQWTSVQVGPFSGGVQNLGNTPLVGFIADGIENPPAIGGGGFAIYSEAQPIGIDAGQELWVRAVADVATLSKYALKYVLG